MYDALLEKIRTKQAIVGVIGLGYVGLPLVRAFVDSGFATLGLDTDADKITALREARSYIEHISPEWISGSIGAQRFQPTGDMQRLGEADAILICVPTPLSDTRDPDLQYVEATTRAIAETLRPGQLIVLESTTYPGTTRERLLPILESRGQTVGEDVFVAYSPEREDPGNLSYTARSIPKVVGGIEPRSRQVAEALYRAVMVEVVPVSSCEVAEACKILENTYRSVNIALVNELKMLFDRIGIDVWEVVDAAKTKPFGFQAFYPGPGLGGHCIPIDPFYLGWLARKHGMPTRFVELAGEVNTAMPHYVVRKVAEALNEQSKPLRGSRILILGAAYKKDVDDPRESPAFKLMELLHAQGSLLAYNDPHIPRLPKMRRYDVPPLASVDLSSENLAAQDCVLIVTDHSAYDYPFIVQHAPLIIDTRNATRDVAHGREKIRKA